MREQFAQIVHLTSGPCQNRMGPEEIVGLWGDWLQLNRKLIPQIWLREWQEKSHCQRGHLLISKHSTTVSVLGGRREWYSWWILVNGFCLISIKSETLYTHTHTKFRYRKAKTKHLTKQKQEETLKSGVPFDFIDKKTVSVWKMCHPLRPVPWSGACLGGRTSVPWPRACGAPCRCVYWSRAQIPGVWSALNVIRHVRLKPLCAAYTLNTNGALSLGAPCRRLDTTGCSTQTQVWWWLPFLSPQSHQSASSAETLWLRRPPSLGLGNIVSRTWPPVENGARDMMHPS